MLLKTFEGPLVITVTCEASAGFVTAPRKYPPLGPAHSHDSQNAAEDNIRIKRKVNGTL